MPMCPNCQSVLPKDTAAEAAIRADERRRVVELLRGATLKIPIEVEMWGGRTHTGTIRSPFPIPFLETLLNLK